MHSVSEVHLAKGRVNVMAVAMDRVTMVNVSKVRVIETYTLR